MNLFEISWQEFSYQLRILLINVLPAFGTLIVLTLMFLLGRFVGRLTEQKRIRTHLDEVTQAELSSKDTHIEELEKYSKEISDSYQLLLSTTHTVQVVSRRLDAIILKALEQLHRPKP